MRFPMTLTLALFEDPQQVRYQRTLQLGWSRSVSDLHWHRGGDPAAERFGSLYLPQNAASHRCIPRTDMSTDSGDAL